MGVTKINRGPNIKGGTDSINGTIEVSHKISKESIFARWGLCGSYKTDMDSPISYFGG